MASNGWVVRPERESIVGGGVRQLSTRRLFSVHSGKSVQVEARSLSGFRSFGITRAGSDGFLNGEPKSESGVGRNRR